LEYRRKAIAKEENLKGIIYSLRQSSFDNYWEVRGAKHLIIFFGLISVINLILGILVIGQILYYIN